MKSIIAAAFLALLAASAGAQITPERKEELKGQFAHPVSMDEAGIYHAPGDGYTIAAKPKITPDGNNYYLLGHIELPDKSGASFIARIKHDVYLSPRANQAANEMRQLMGRTQEPYFEVKIPKSLLQAYKSNARLNEAVGVIGRYTGNTEIIMTTNKRVVIPVVEALALDFNGSYSSIQLPKKAEKQEATATTAPAAVQPSFDCSKASTRVERLICSDEDLARLDVELLEIYNLAKDEHPRSHDGDTGKSSFPLGADQTRWRTKVRDACKDVACLKTAYERRAIEIKTKFPY